MKASTNTYLFRFILSLFVYLGTSWRIRGDHGTENIKVAGIQRFFQYAAVDEKKASNLENPRQIR